MKILQHIWRGMQGAAQAFNERASWFFRNGRKLKGRDHLLVKSDEYGTIYMEIEGQEELVKSLAWLYYNDSDFMQLFTSACQHIVSSREEFLAAQDFVNEITKDIRR